ncbi:MAG: hypothetical protein JST11_29670, partial [Acidobacteria bacterium]|nr:hypothetical protein [Acidobacteriota bacterium]
LVAQLNQQLSGSGVSARINSTDGAVEFVGGAFSIASTGGATLTGTDNAFLTNDTLNHINQQTYTTTTGAQTLQFTVGGVTTNVTLATGVTLAGAVSAINQAMNSKGIYALSDGTGIDFQGNSAFTAQVTAGGANGGFGAVQMATATSSVAPTVSGSGTNAATNAIQAINSALTTLGNIQGTVGAGQNKLQYAINLATSQITSFSAAQSRIRDADVAAEAANLTKAQVLAQASLAAMAQANSAPQQVLSLLKG